MKRRSATSPEVEMRKVWRGWLKFAYAFGTVQMVIILTLVYWVFITLAYIPFGLIADPLRLRKRRRSLWTDRAAPKDVLDSMTRQG